VNKIGGIIFKFLMSKLGVLTIFQHPVEKNSFAVVAFSVKNWGYSRISNTQLKKEFPFEQQFLFSVTVKNKQCFS
jgi:hypothetical protein